MSDTLDLVGRPVPEGVGRDAVHIAMVPVVTAQILSPGEHVGWVDKHEMTVGRVAQPLGIIDPYLRGSVRPHTRVFLFLYPQTITSLKHVWQHPEFPDEVKVVEKVVEVEKIPGDPAESEKWLRKFCKDEHLQFDLLMEAVSSPDGRAFEKHGDDGWDTDGYSCDDGYITSYGRDAYGTIPDEFWHHCEVFFQRPIKFRAERFFCVC
jgi:hypothetical protein